MAQKIELRKRNGGIFSGNDNLMLPVTHVDFVLGLLDGNSKLNISLLPSSMLNTKRLAGSINADTTFASLYTLIGTFNESKTSMYPGTYFISNGKNLISASTDHVIYYNDDGLNAASTVELENGDHLFYVKYGSEYAWNDTENTLTVPTQTRISDLTPPYNTIDPSHIFATEAEAASFNPSSNGEYALITGFKWVPATAGEYNLAGYKITESATIGGPVVEADINYLVVPSWSLWDYGQSSVVLKLDDVGIGITYWKLAQIDATPPQSPKIYESISYSNKHIWGVVNNTYNMATTSSAGLMSASDKAKLNGLSNYNHHTQAVINANATDDGVSVIDSVTVNTEGHVTAVGTRNLSNATPSSPGVMSASDKTKLDGIVLATTSTAGLVELATSTEAIVATDASRALTPATGLSLLNYNQDVSYFSSLSAANSESLPDGATAIIVTGTITI